MGVGGFLNGFWNGIFFDFSTCSYNQFRVFQATWREQTEGFKWKYSAPKKIMHN